MNSCRARARPFASLFIVLVFILSFIYGGTASAMHIERVPQSILDAERAALVYGVPHEVVKRLKAVALIYVQISGISEEDSYAASGSGFLIAEDLLLSALHILPPVEELILSRRLSIKIFINGKTVSGHVPDSRYYDVKNDLVVIKLSEKIPIGPIPIAQKDPQIGETVYNFGYAGGLEDRPVLLACRYVGDTRAKPSRFLLTTPGFELGYSGSPLLNSKGEVIGVADAVTKVGVFGFSVPWDAITELLKKIPDFKR